MIKTEDSKGCVEVEVKGGAEMSSENWLFDDPCNVMALAEIVNRDPSLNEIRDLPLGWKAGREGK